MRSSSESALRCEIVIIPEMTARRLMTLVARCFLRAASMIAAVLKGCCADGGRAKRRGQINSNF
jgi:hypothetical protein